MLPISEIQRAIENAVGLDIIRSFPLGNTQQELEVIPPTVLSAADGIYLNLEMTEGVSVVNKRYGSYNNLEMQNIGHDKNYGISIELFGKGPSSSVFVDDCMYFSDICAETFYNIMTVDYTEKDISYNLLNTVTFTSTVTSSISATINGRCNQRNSYYVDSDTWKTFYSITQSSGVTTFTAYRDSSMTTAVLQGSTTAITTSTLTASISLTGTIDYTTAGSTFESLVFISGLTGTLSLTYNADSTGEMHITNNYKEPIRGYAPGYSIIFDQDNIVSNIFRTDNDDDFGRNAFIFSVTYNAIVQYSDGKAIFNRR